MANENEIEVVDAQLRDKVWTYAQRGVVALVVFLAGVFLGYRLWGQAGQLQEKVEELTERNQVLVKERDTLRSQIALVERDKKEMEERLRDLEEHVKAAEARAEAAEAKLAKAEKPLEASAPAGAPAPGGPPGS